MSVVTEEAQRNQAVECVDCEVAEDVEKVLAVDPLRAPIDWMVEDLEAYGYIRPETNQAAVNQIETDYVEGIERSFINSFIRELVGEHVVNERAEPMVTVCERDLIRARNDAKQDPALEFYVGRSEADLANAQLVDQLARGELEGDTVILVSAAAFEVPDEVAARKNYRPGHSMVQIFHRLRHDAIEGVTVTMDDTSVESLCELIDELGGDSTGITTGQDIVERPIVTTIGETSGRDFAKEKVMSAHDSIIAKRAGKDVCYSRTTEQSWERLQASCKEIREQQRTVYESLARSRVGERLEPYAADVMRTVLHTKRPDGRLLVDEDYQTKLRADLATGKLSREGEEVVVRVVMYSSWAQVKEKLNGREPVQEPTTGLGGTFRAGGRAAYNYEEMDGCPGGDGRLGLGMGAMAGFSLFRLSPAEAQDAIFGKKDKVLHCVTCPFCTQTVDAIITATHIKCPSCKAQASL